MSHGPCKQALMRRVCQGLRLKFILPVCHLLNVNCTFDKVQERKFQFCCTRLRNLEINKLLFVVWKIIPWGHIELVAAWVDCAAITVRLSVSCSCLAQIQSLELLVPLQMFQRERSIAKIKTLHHWPGSSCRDLVHAGQSSKCNTRPTATPQPTPTLLLTPIFT